MMMKKTSIMAVWFITMALLAVYGSASMIDQINISDTLFPDRSLSELVSMTISNNDQANFTLVLPRAAHGIMLGNESVNGTIVVIPTPCSRCSFSVSYLLGDVARYDVNNSLAFSRTLNYDLKPARFRYSVTLPQGYGVDKSNDLAEPPIVPAESRLTTDGTRFTIEWNSTNQAFPIRYYVKYAPTADPAASVGMAVPLLTGLCALFFSASVFFWLKYRRAVARPHARAKHQMAAASDAAAVSDATVVSAASPARASGSELPSAQTVVVPGSLLSVDEKTVLSLIKENNNDIRQKEVVKILNWSKSKVSAIVSNLEYKKILRREKLGRSYRIELLRDYVEGI
jgi:uncharacterized membrane protein